MHPAGHRPYPEFTISYTSKPERRDQLQANAVRLFARRVTVDVTANQVLDPAGHVAGGFVTTTTTTTSPSSREAATR